MFLIKLLLVLVTVILYSFFARACLKLLNIAVTIQNMVVFVISGLIAGVVSLFVYGAMMAEQQGHLGDEPQIFNMVSVSVLIAVVVSVAAVKIFSASGRT